MQHGKLYLIPTPLHESALHTIPPYVIEVLHRLDYFIAERAKTARHFIKATKPARSLQVLTVYELGKHTPIEEWQSFLAPALEGYDIGLLSEAGCPGVADPGAEIVRLAYEKGVEVVPMVGPSSILLALMASGMNGQQFCFQGYLSPKKPQLQQDLKRLEQLAKRHRQTQIFIETPYRNESLVETALKTLSPKTRFCIACDLTSEQEYVQTYSIEQWRKTPLPNLKKRPTIFLLL